MGIDINPRRVERLRGNQIYGPPNSCFADIVASVAGWLGRDYELMFSECWSIRFNSLGDRSHLGERIGVEKNNGLNLLKQYHGIQFIYKNIEDVNSALEIIKRELIDGRPVIGIVDAYWVPWDDVFQKLHSSGHFFLIVDIDKLRNDLTCVDGYFMQKDVIIPRGNFATGFKNLMTVSILNDRQNDLYKIINSAAKSFMGDNKSKNSVKAIYDFAEEIEKINDLEQEITGYDGYWSTPLWTAFNEIVKGHVQFATTLRYIARKIPALTLKLMEVSERVLQMSEQWFVVRGMIGKAVVVKEPKLIINRLSNKIKNIAYEEEIVAQELLMIVQEKTNLLNKNAVVVNNSSCILEGIKTQDMIYADLTQYFNNDGFSNHLSFTCSADLTGFGYCFSMQGLPVDETWEIEGMKFKFPTIAEEQNNNISCLSQLIPIPVNNYSYFMILMCAEFGDFVSQLEIMYDNGKIESIPMCVTEWNSLPKFGEVIAWKGNIIKRVESSIKLIESPHYIFAKVYPLNSNLLLSGIRLPECPNIHVFSITVCK